MVELAIPRRTLTVRAGALRRLVDARITLGLTSCLTVGGLAFANGGFFPVAWGWSALALLWVAMIALALRAAPELGPREIAFLGAFAALTAWIALSLVWTSGIPGTVLEVERTLVYLAAALAALLLVRRASASALLLGTWAAIVAVSTYALATRLFPDRLGVYDPISGSRLSDPVGYWNALGILVAIGTLLALGLAARSGPVVRCAAAASTVVLVLTLYFTFSRGSWIALFVGLGAAVAIDRRRLQLITTALVLAPAPALAIWAASSSHALTHRVVAFQQAAHDGHGLAAITIGLAAAAALAVLTLEWLEAALRVPRALVRVYAAALAGALAVCLVAVFARVGSPATFAEKAYREFNAPLRADETNLNSRLFVLSSTGRSRLYHVAWSAATDHPVFGTGAGTFADYWFQHRSVPATAHDAHSLYLETLTELGPPGLLLLALALGAPLAAVPRARRSPFGCVAFAAYAAFLVHASFDWDWEMPAVTVAALFCGIALLALGRRMRRKPLRPLVRWPALAVTAALGAFALLGLLGNAAVSASSQATHAGDYARAASQARRALRLEPWSSEPWRKLAEAQLGQGNPAAARKSFSAAIAKDSTDWTLWFELAQASRGGARDRALAQAKRLNPLSHEIRKFERTYERRHARRHR